MRRGSVNPASRSRKQPRFTPVRTISRCPCSTRRAISRRTASARRLRVSPRTSGITQKAHENEQPSWILTKARVRSSRVSLCHQAIGPTAPPIADRCLLTGTPDHGHVLCDVAERAVEARAAACRIDATM